MKTYEHSTFKEITNTMLARHPLASLKKSLPELKEAFNERLGDEYVLLINFPLGDTGIHIPLTLSGPAGLQILNPIDLRGSYRARENEWLAYNIDRNTFLPERVNLVARTISYAQAVRKFLDEQKLQVSVIEPVMLFLDPTITVDTARPSARVLIWGGLRHYARNLSNAHVILNTEQLFNINRALARGSSSATGASPTRPRPATGSLDPKTAPRPARSRGRRVVMLVLSIILFMAVAAAIVTLYAP